MTIVFAAGRRNVSHVAQTVAVGQLTQVRQHAAKDGQDGRGLLVQAFVDGAGQTLEVVEGLRR